MLMGTYSIFIRDVSCFTNGLYPYWKRNILGKLDQYHVCICSSFLYCQAINSHGIDSLGLKGTFSSKKDFRKHLCDLKVVH